MDASPLINFKSQREEDEFPKMRENLKFVTNEMAEWAEKRRLDFVITDILSDAYEDKRLNRVSRSHAEGRAFDLSLRGWTEEQAREFERIFEWKFEHIAAWSKRTGRHNLVEIHDNGNGRHAHIQVAQ